MKNSAKDVIAEKKGVAEGLGAVMLVMTLLVAVGAIVGNYAVLSKKASHIQAVELEIANRAELYTSTLNSDLVNPPAPATARQCTTTTKTCTQVLSATPAADGTQLVLRVQGDAAGVLGTTITKDVTLTSNAVTHVTDIDVDGNNVWALSDEGLRFKAWSVAEGQASTIKPEDLTGPGATNYWVQVDDRAGIDAKGALWGWGKNDIGQAGIGAAGSAEVTPKRISTAGQQFRSVVTGDDRAYAIDSAGNAWVWGKNNAGQLGLGHTNHVNKPTKVPGLRAISFAIGANNALAITTAGALVHTGAQAQGFTAPATTSFQTLNEGTVYTAVAASVGNSGVAVLRADGALVVNGSIPIPPTTTKFVTVARGKGVGYAISTTGELYSWGNNAEGALARAATSDSSTPLKVTSSKRFVAVQGTENGVLAIDAHGGLHYSGLIAFGETGAGNLPKVSQLTPLMPETRFRGILSNDHDSATALLDTAGNLYGMSTRLDGLWSIGHTSTNPLPIRMTDPAGFDAGRW